MKTTYEKLHARISEILRGTDLDPLNLKIGDRVSLVADPTHTGVISAIVPEIILSDGEDNIKVTKDEVKPEDLSLSHLLAALQKVELKRNDFGLSEISGKFRIPIGRNLYALINLYKPVKEQDEWVLQFILEALK